MRTFEKQYTRDNSLMSFQVWHENQTKVWQDLMGWAAPSFLLNAIEGVAEVYYEPTMFVDVEKKVGEFLKDNAALQQLLNEYIKYLEQLEPIWAKRQALGTQAELINFFNLAVQGWSGMSLSYFIPTLPAELVAPEQVAQALQGRERGNAYFEDTDRIIQLTLQKLYPDLGELARYMSIEELKEQHILDREVLAQRQQYYIFFEGEIITNMSLKEFAKMHQLTIEDTQVTETPQEIKGTVAMKGQARGPVKVIFKKESLANVQAGDILVTPMTTPDYLPAMHKAAAFITDEGGITCHAAIVSRELGKPCIIGTKIATQVLKDGDLVEVDANTGIIRILP